jgi:hypothetical protein
MSNEMRVSKKQTEGLIKRKITGDRNCNKNRFLKLGAVAHILGNHKSAVVAIFLLCFFFIQITSSNAAYSSEEVLHHVFLTGNTADILDEAQVSRSLQKLFSSLNEPFTLIINGDLISEELHRENIPQYALRIEKLLDAVSGLNNGKAVILHGERDWADSGKNGWATAGKLEDMIKSLDFDNVKWSIKNGCPGPRIIELDESLILIAMNTQWWNHPYDKPEPVDGQCRYIDEDWFFEEIEDSLDVDYEGKNILLAGHYPVFSFGEYGGQFPLKKYLLPFPVLGGFIAAYRQNVGTTDDIVNEHYEEFRQELEDLILSRSSLIYLSGHDFNLQIIKKEDNYFINSGSIGSSGFARREKSTLFSQKLRGLIELVYYSSGRVDSVVYEYRGEEEGFQRHTLYTLYRSECEEGEGKIPVNTAFTPCRELLKVKEEMTGVRGGRTGVAAGEGYAAGPFKRFFFGKHYRESWIQEIEVPYLDLDTTYGGLKPYKRGGGRQTRSLKFKAGNGLRYTFRSVDKFPAGRLPYELRNTVAEDLLQDQTSSEQPYGALAAGFMLDALDILHPHPKLYVMPDDEKLGPFRKDFGNMLGMLEEFPTDPGKKEKAFAGADDINKSYELFRKLYRDQDAGINAERYAQARVFDILVGDWSRHDDNWRWAGFKDDEGIVYEPIPRDRDQVFSRLDGLLPWFADREWAVPSLENFGYRIRGLRSLTWQARHLDRFLLSELDRKDWFEAAQFVQDRIDDEVIERAVRNMAPEIYELSGKEIEDKLKVRVRGLQKYADEYYSLLSKEVDIVGSVENEYFDVQRNPDGTVRVRMYDAEEGGEKGKKLLYSRTFYPTETGEIRLFGLGGQDVFNIRGESKHSIKVRLAGGRDEDVYEDQSAVQGVGRHTLIYEKDKQGEINLGKEAKTVTPANEDLYDYDRTAFEYSTYFPLILFGYDSANSLKFGAGVSVTGQKYGKEDYSSTHKFKGSYTLEDSKLFEYEGRFHHVIRKWDLELNACLGLPGLGTYFFGIGNDTEKNDNLFKDDFNTFDYNTYRVGFGILRDFWKISCFGIEAFYEWNDNPEPRVRNNNVLAGGDFFGEDDVGTAGIQAILGLDFRDDRWLPEKGSRLFLSYRSGWITNESWNNYGQLFGFMESFATAELLVPWTLGMRVGGGYSYGTIPFYQKFTLGEESYLRGFRKNRFAGENIFLLNSDLRFLLFDRHTRFVPLKFGVKPFLDIGQVIDADSEFGDFHYGYGFGVFLVFWKDRATLNTSFGFSDEEDFLFHFALGTAFE